MSGLRRSAGSGEWLVNYAGNGYVGIPVWSGVAGDTIELVLNTNTTDKPAVSIVENQLTLELDKLTFTSIFDVAVDGVPVVSGEFTVTPMTAYAIKMTQVGAAYTTLYCWFVWL